MKKARYFIPLALIVLVGVFVAIPTGAAEFADSAFRSTWERTDKPVGDGQAVRTWIWGPEAFTGGLQEPYVEGSLADGTTGQRLVQYFDKSRMEITNPQGDTNSIWYVTNGLLVVELVTGRMQVGDNSFQDRSPAAINVAGDANDPNGPQYISFGSVLQAPSQPVGSLLTQRINRAGQVTDDPSLAGQNIQIGSVDTVTNHGIAAPFWDFMNSSGVVYQDGQIVNDALFQTPVFATGRPITEPYWANVLVGGQDHLVLIQCFERRCLTYTPANAPTWRVEMGNIGQHYHSWRYSDPAIATATATTPPTATAPATATATQPPVTDYAYLSEFGSESLPEREMQSPADIAFDSAGNMYVLDSEANRVQKFDQNGIWLREWGSFGTENGQFDEPEAIAVDADSNVYVADSGNDRVQKFDQNGAWLLNFPPPADGFINPTGIAADGIGNVFVVTHGTCNPCENLKVHRYTAAGIFQFSFGGPDLLKQSNHVAVSPDNATIYVADTGNDRVQVFSSNGTFVRTIGLPGSGNADGQFLRPVGVAISPDNSSIYVGDNGNHRIQVFDVSGTFLRTWGTEGADPGQLKFPNGVAIQADDTLYVADYGNDRVQSLKTSDGSFISQLKDDSRGRFLAPFGITVMPNTDFVVVDLALNQIKIFDELGAYVTQWGHVAAAPLVDLSAPLDVAVDSQNKIYVTDANNNRIVKYDAHGFQEATWGTPGFGPGAGNGEFSSPAGIDVDGDDNVYVVDSGNNRVQKFSSTGTYISAWGEAGNGNGEFTNPTAIAIHGDAVYVVDTGNSRVQRFDLDGSYESQFGSAGSNDSQFLVPLGIDTDALGFIYVSDSGNDRIQKFTPEGTYLADFGTEGTGDGELMGPAFLVVLPNGNVAVTDTANLRVQIFAPN